MTIFDTNYLQLYVVMYFYRIRKIFYKIYLVHWRDRNKYYHTKAEINGNKVILTSSQEIEPHHQMQFRVISKRPFLGSIWSPYRRHSQRILNPTKRVVEKGDIKMCRYLCIYQYFHHVFFLSNVTNNISLLLLPGSGCIDTAIWMHYMDANKTAGEEARWQLHKNAASNLEQVRAATPHKTPTVRPPASYHENYSN